MLINRKLNKILLKNKKLTKIFFRIKLKKLRKSVLYGRYDILYIKINIYTEDIHI